MSLLKRQVIDVISNIYLKDKISLSTLASEIILKGNNIGFSVDIGKYSIQEIEEIKQEALNRLSKIKNIGQISIILTSNISTNKQEKPKHYIDRVKRIILVSSGKGGVGKSTIAVALAENLLNLNYRVGIVDADIYGPSIPTMFKINHKPQIIDGRIIPITARGLQLNSIGFLIDNAAPLAWRGPMASKAIYQLLSLTLWDDLDYLVIDMPPGTGDIHLSVLSNYHITSAIIVTTPQKLAQIDVAKSIELYQKFNIPVLSIIENMSYLIGNDGKKIEIFKGNSGEILANKYNIPFVHKVPINTQITEACDNGSSLKYIIDLPINQLI